MVSWTMPRLSLRRDTLIRMKLVAAKTKPSLWTCCTSSWVCQRSSLIYSSRWFVRHLMGPTLGDLGFCMIRFLPASWRILILLLPCNQSGMTLTIITLVLSNRNDEGLQQVDWGYSFSRSLHQTLPSPQPPVFSVPHECTNLVPMAQLKNHRVHILTPIREPKNVLSYEKRSSVQLEWWWNVLGKKIIRVL